MKYVLTVCAACLLFGVQIAKADVGGPFKNCGLMAEVVLATEQKEQDGGIKAVVENDICIKAESYSRFMIADAKRWSAHIVGRDESGKAVGWSISPLEKGIATTLVIVQQDGSAKSLKLISQ